MMGCICIKDVNNIRKRTFSELTEITPIPKRKKSKFGKFFKMNKKFEQHIGNYPSYKGECEIVYIGTDEAVIKTPEHTILTKFRDIKTYNIYDKDPKIRCDALYINLQLKKLLKQYNKYECDYNGENNTVDIFPKNDQEKSPLSVCGWLILNRFAWTNESNPIKIRYFERN